MKYEIILENEEDGRFFAHVPSLPGCHSWGKTREEAITKHSGSHRKVFRSS